ncbi:MAG TPA: L,D-transpeptidase [Solirubrobacteraceae bacterium]|nr:L,D-transpeptidase [Solirubrobacteraceae bacterium]
MSAERRAVALAAIVLVACAAVAALLVLRDDDEPAGPRPQALDEVPGVRPQPARVLRGPLGAQLHRRTQLRARPGGRVIRSVGTRTEYGSDAVLAVVARRPGWVGVLSQHAGNGKTAWIPTSNATLLLEPYTLHVVLSARRLVVRRRGRVVRRIVVAIGRPDAPTPTGRFAVTDLLRITGGGGAYGCCALALTGRQPNVPQGWTGGDRIAIHGTSNEATLGSPASSGCLRAADRSMRWLLAHVPLGAHVRIRA